MKKSTFQLEISYEGGVPLIPNVAVVLVLHGSDYDMGYQYVQQINQIFGPWVLKNVQCKLTRAETSALKAYQWHLKKHTPEFIDMFRGMAAGATDAGVKLSYEEVLADFCTEEFEKSLLTLPGSEPSESQKSELPLNECSGFAAWGSCTKDGRLIGVGISDTMTSFQSVIICLPETGNNYIIGMNVPRIIKFGLCPGGSSHPAMNSKGLVYVHHGGCATLGNEKRDYSVPLSLQIQHTLRFASNATDALTMELVYPRGTRAVGLWADISGDAFVLECRDPKVVRRAGDHGEQDFLYATNNCLDESLKPFLKNMIGWPLDYYPHGGWNPSDMNSVGRCLYMWNALHNYHGKVDMDFVKMMLRFPTQRVYPILDEVPTQIYKVLGVDWNTHIGHLANQRVGIMLPDNGDKGLYYLCTGPLDRHVERLTERSHLSTDIATRRAEQLTAGSSFFQIAATHTFFELRLASSPEDIVTAAKKRAQYDLYYANKELRKLTYWDVPYAPLDAIFNKAAAECQKGDYYLVLAQKTKGNESVCNYAKSVRGFTRCQAYARQVYESLVPPACKPTDLGLGEWFGSWGRWESYSPGSS